MTSWAVLTASATPGFASKVWGSVFGFFSIEVTLTNRPPIWAATLPYWSSAATTRMRPPAPGLGEEELQAISTSGPIRSHATRGDGRREALGRR